MIVGRTLITGLEFHLEVHCKLLFCCFFLLLFFVSFRCFVVAFLFVNVASF